MENQERKAIGVSCRLDSGPSETRRSRLADIRTVRLPADAQLGAGSVFDAVVVIPERQGLRWFEDIEEECTLTSFGHERYRLEEVVALLPLQQGDFDARDLAPPSTVSHAPRRLEFICRIRRSGFSRRSFMLAEGALDHPAWQVPLERLRKVGGQCCTAFGGVLVVSIPPHVDLHSLGFPY